MAQIGVSISYFYKYALCGTGVAVAPVPSLSPGARPLRVVPPIRATARRKSWRNNEAGVLRGAKTKHRSEDGGAKQLSNVQTNVGNKTLQLSVVRRRLALGVETQCQFTQIDSLEFEYYFDHQVQEPQLGFVQGQITLFRSSQFFSRIYIAWIHSADTVVNSLDWSLTCTLV